MTAGEFAFMAMGLLLGVAVGAGLIEVLRSRPPAPRQVRVTIAPDSIPTRAPTLATDPFDAPPPGPAPYGPGDRRMADRPATMGTATATVERAAVATAPASIGTGRAGTRAFVPIAVDREGDGPAVGDGAEPSGAGPSGAEPSRDAQPGPALVTVGLVASAESTSARMTLDPATARQGRAAPEVTAAPGRAATAVAVLDGTPVPSGRPDQPSPASGPCAELLAVAQDRCAVADRAREASAAAQDALREAQRSYDDHQARAEEADDIADPRQVRQAKERAQAAFRRARDGATTREDIEQAASTWLLEINRVNRAAKDALARAAKERAAARALVVVIERLSLEADAARIAAESAGEACLMAREAVADCQEAEARGRREAEQREAERRTPAPPYPEEAPELDLRPAEGEPRILRMLRGDGDALVAAAAELGGDDADARRRWQLDLTHLCDAIAAQAIDACALDVPDDQPFFEPFTHAQRRDIISALASLGYRYDGLGGFDDERIPSQRDLSLAVGYAGLDPMRIRRWPSESEMPHLLDGASVAADEYLVAAAGGLTLGELVDLLGRRADGLTELWNDWGRVRAHLLVVDR